MQFKHPEILYFLFLLALPILVHLFQLRRFKKEYFTNVRFLKELSVQTRKSSKLKKWLLLATRLLLLAAIIIAFAQPFFNAKDSKNATNELYILLDNSFSMQAKGQNGELLRRAVEDLLEHTPETQNFSLLTNSEAFWNTDIKSLQKDLQKLKYSAAPFNLESLMAQVKSRKSPFNKDILILTDAVGLKENQLKSIGKDFNTHFVIAKAEQKSNISVDSVYIGQTMDHFYEIGVRFSAFGATDKEVPVALYNGQKLIAKTLAKFDSNRKTLHFTIPKQDFNGFVSIEDNGLSYDNTFYFSISKPKKINVVSIGEPEKSNFLSRIYTDAEFTYHNFALSSLDYNILDEQDAIVLNELKDIPQALQTTLKAFVQKGGNLIVIPSAESSPANLNALLANFGPAKFSSGNASVKLITKIAFGHPLYTTVFEKKIDNFQYPQTKFSFALSSPSPSVLSYEDQSTFLMALASEVSSVYVFAAPLNEANSNFQHSPLIVPTFYNMAQTVSKTGVSAVTIGESLPYLVQAKLSKDEIVNVANADEKFIPVQQILDNKVKLTFGNNPQTAGNYGIFKQDERLGNISFNYARTEGDLAAANEDAVSDFKTDANAEAFFDTLQTGRTDNELWKWFVILTLLFLATELFIQKFAK